MIVKSGALIDIRMIALGPGVRLQVSPDARWKTTTLLARVAAPLDEATSETALVPFLLTRGTERSPTARALTARLEDLFDAELDCDVLRLGDAQVVEARLDVVGRAYVKSTGRDPLAEGIALLAEVLTRPARDRRGLFPEETFEVERENLVHEIQGQKDERTEYALERAHRVLGRGEPSARSELGDVASAEAASRAAVTARHAALVRERPLDILVAGDVDPAEVEALVRAAFPFEERGFDEAAARRTRLAPEASAARAGASARGGGGPAREREVIEGHQAHVCVCWRGGAPYLSEGYAALLVANAVLGGDQNSRLFLGVRERDGLAYEAFTVMDRAKGHVIAHMGVDPANTARVEAAALAEMARLASEPPAQGELDEAKKAVIERVRDLEDDPQARLGFAYARALAGRPDVTPEGLLASVAAVTAEDARSAAARLVHDGTVVLAP